VILLPYPVRFVADTSMAARMERFTTETVRRWGGFGRAKRAIYFPHCLAVSVV